tara:strand:+ start:49 stop:279 length:231 start_codon:yes stop_codon:yes gene_type:complete
MPYSIDLFKKVYNLIKDHYGHVGSAYYDEMKGDMVIVAEERGEKVTWRISMKNVDTRNGEKFLDNCDKVPQTEYDD